MRTPNYPNAEPTAAEQNIKLLYFLLNCLFFAPLALRLVSRKFGTVGAQTWFPGLIVSAFELLAVSGSCIAAWWYCQIGCWLWMLHAACYFKRHREGNGVHTHYVGETYLQDELTNDCVFALILAALCLAAGWPRFALWWALNIPLTYIAIEMIHMRDSARKRVIRSQQIEHRYWQNLMEDGDDD